MKKVDVLRAYDRVRSALAFRGLAETVRVPRLFHRDGKYTIGGLTLAFFASRLGEVGTKRELVAFLRSMRCASTDPQPRHLGMQCGLNFLVQGCYHPPSGRTLRRGEYSLLDLEGAHPNHGSMHRQKPDASQGLTIKGAGFEALKNQYGRRCACCGSKEGERHLKNHHVVTALERGHCDPRAPLSLDNCIPICTMCNRVYRDKAVFNRRGFVVRWIQKEQPQRAEPSADDDAASSSNIMRMRMRMQVVGVRIHQTRLATTNKEKDKTKATPQEKDKTKATPQRHSIKITSSPAVRPLLRRSPRLAAREHE